MALTIGLISFTLLFFVSELLIEFYKKTLVPVKDEDNVNELLSTRLRGSTAGHELHQKLAEQLLKEKKNRHSLSQLEPLMAALVSLALLATSLYIILSHTYDESAQKWAFGAAGSILGFWLSRSTK